MYTYSETSKRRLATCHPDIQKVFNEAIKYVDIKILEGVRSLERQKELFEAVPPKTKTMKSKHLKQPDGWSYAIDAGLYPINWQDRDRFVYLGGFIQALAHKMYNDKEITHKIRWGGDWDSDQIIKEHSFFDGPHFEITE